MPRLLRHDFDRAYLDRLVAGDADTEQHFARYFGELLTVKLRSRLRSAAEVEDVRQETLTRVLTTLKKKGGITTAEALGSYVNSTCNFVLMETYRQGKRAEPLDEERDDRADHRAGAEASLLAGEERHRVREALADLPPRDQDVLRLLFFEDRDKDDICRELNIDRNYLRVMLHRAKSHFRERFSADTALEPRAINREP
ncbi:MAG TPA: sigma-70 family RNA polymerase sigma factor [Vicinamibacterales bacterium]|nr:sigma-70 family RNA polymerase sigma factor [Vicinamibacterales bacterium]